ncbi:hypothetical protein [Prolixibacter sp. NT017]|uniref:hypothetical protein n=1 Tax=Prolixibacter sp. NT017 TaxID=2652390 RepID=UPI0012886540|nr:hypothetical protein [Prolixibacter sp. NT017]GET25935.1 hypothetical protein NT017_22640 [Prolixibacter sp. NT017]
MTPDELWNLEPKEFNKWRRENDLKSLFNLFQEKFPLFSEWLLEYNLTVDIILDTDKPGLFIGEKGEYIILKP